MNENEIMVTEDNASLLQQADVEGVTAFFQNYQELTQALLNPSDYQSAGKNKFKKKSAWRKYATAFNLSDRIINEEIIRDDEYRIISAKYEVEVTASNGRTAVGVASCSIYDKIDKKDAVEPSAFELRKRFTHAEHDIISTAHTRAKNRAISDIIGTGEVSAEEMENSNGVSSKKAVPHQKKRAAKKQKKEEAHDNVIEAKAKIKKETVGDEPAKKSLKELADENSAINKAVKVLQEDPAATITVGSVSDKLLDLCDLGKISVAEYREAKELI